MKLLPSKKLKDTNYAHEKKTSIVVYESMCEVWVAVDVVEFVCKPLFSLKKTTKHIHTRGRDFLLRNVY